MMSDTNPEFFEAPARRPASQLTTEQRGLAVAALVAFFGIAYLGPALTRFRRAPTIKERIKRRWRQTRRAPRKGRQAGSRLGRGITRWRG